MYFWTFFKLFAEDKIRHDEGETYNSEEHSDVLSSGNFMNDMSDSEILPKADAVTGESFDSSDTGSYSSDTPLLACQRNNANQLSEAQDNDLTDKLRGNELDKADKDDEEACDTYVYVEIDPSLGHLAPVERQLLGSGVSVALSYTREVDIVKTNPVHVFGSGWEFGSVCSVNLHSSEDTTLPQRNARVPAPPWQDRLLSRIFKDKIESIRVDKNPGKESEKFIYTIASDSPGNVGQNGERKNLKNLLILSTSITFLYVAVFGLRNLQSSINSENGLGVFSLASLSAAFLFGSLVSPFVVRRYRPKLCLSWSCFGHLIYVIANYYPNFYVIIPASVIHGLSSALLWNALCTYITEIGLDECFVKGKMSSSVLSRYFGIFFLMLQLSMVLGNLISSLILSQAEHRIKERQTKNTVAGTVTYNSVIDHTTSGVLILTGNESVSLIRCGGAHCDHGGGNETKPAVDDLDKLFLLGTYSSCAVISILVIQCFLDQLSNYTPHSSSMKMVLKQAGSVLAMIVDQKFYFVVLLCLYTAISNAFVIADVLKVQIHTYLIFANQLWLMY